MMTTIDNVAVMERPLPLIDNVSRPFWQACAEHRLVMQKCDNCGTFAYPAKLSCGNCQSTALGFTEVSGRGKLYSFTVQRQAFHASFLPHIPNVIAIVQLEESTDLLVVANLTGLEPDDIHIGMAVETTFDDREGVTVPMFRPAHNS